MILNHLERLQNAELCGPLDCLVTAIGVELDVDVSHMRLTCLSSVLTDTYNDEAISALVSRVGNSAGQPLAPGR